MQTQPIQLARQQFILSKLGYYTGPIDGVWGAKTIEAQQRFENRPSEFRPARQNGGLPFGDDSKLPSSYWRESQGDLRLVCHDCIEANKAEWADIVSKLGDRKLRRAAPPTDNAPKQQPPVEIIRRGGGDKQQQHHGKKSQGKEEVAASGEVGDTDKDDVE